MLFLTPSLSYLAGRQCQTRERGGTMQNPPVFHNVLHHWTSCGSADDVQLIVDTAWSRQRNSVEP
jgi:hypothetical protein